MGALMCEVESKTDWRAFSKLETADELNCYVDARTHSEYFHYTSLYAIDKILSGNTIRISSSDRFNDEQDKAQFGNKLEQKKYYSLSFSSGKNENLSLWYLYSGIEGKGGRISFTYSKLQKMLSEGSFYLVEYDYKLNKEVDNGLRIELCKENNMLITLRDVLYSRPTQTEIYVDLKYNTMKNYDHVTLDEYNEYKEKNIGFNKNLIWYYEKESRLLIKLIGDAAQLIEPTKNYAVLWKVDGKLLREMKITFAPEIVDKTNIGSFEYINDFIFNTSRADLSENAGEIEMNLCSKCVHKTKPE